MSVVGGRARLGLAGLAAGVVVCHTASSLLHERLFLTPGWTFAWLLTAIEFGVFAVATLVERHARARGGWGGDGDAAAQAPAAAPRLVLRRVDVVCAAVLVGSKGFANAALNHLDYSTKIVCNSGKVLFVMAAARAMGMPTVVGLRRAAYAALLAAGTVVFSAADRVTSPRFSAQGVVFIGVSLSFSAFLGNIQQSALQVRAAAGGHVGVLSRIRAHGYMHSRMRARAHPNARRRRRRRVWTAARR